MILPEWLMYTGAPDWVGFMDMESVAAEYMLSEDGRANFIATIDAMSEPEAKRMLFWVAIQLQNSGDKNAVV
jgi:hypothetical protein